MRAILCPTPGDASVLTLGDAPRPELGHGEVRIAVHATSVNRADVLQRRGLYPSPKGASPILGLECAGTVSERSDDVRELSVGDRVMALLPGGGYAEEAVVDARCVLPVPAGLGDDEAGGFMETFLTAFSNLFLLGGVGADSTVLVQGGGSGVGTAALSLCREAGTRALVTAGSEAKRTRCLSHGAALAFDYHHDFAEAVLTATGGRGVDVVLDCVGAPYLDAHLRCLAPDGRLVVIGLMGGARGGLDLALILRKRLRIIGSTLRSLSAAKKGGIVGAFRERFGAALDAGRLRPVVDSVWPLADAAGAHRRLEAGEHFGKVILRV